jgi:cysteine desulfurase/selenocysteine lyase
MINSQRIKEDFPIFSNNPDLCYLDSAATTQKPRQVVEAIEDYYYSCNSNVHRGIYKISEDATNRFEASRDNISNFIGSSDSRQIVFTRNATESLNLLAYTLGKSLHSGDEVLLSTMEHHSNMIPWQFLREKGVVVKYADITPEGTLDLQDLSQKITKRTRIVSLTHVSNVLGCINPVQQIAKIVHDNSSIFIVDGAQSVPHMPLAVEKMDCDFLAFSGHKMLGPSGIGILYGKYDLLDSLPPFMGGGEMIMEVSLNGATWNETPLKFEAGTPNIEGAIGLSAAVNYLKKIGMDSVRSHERDLISYAMHRASEVEDLRFYGPRDPEKHGGVFTFNIGEIPAFDLGRDLAEKSVKVSVNGIHPHDTATVMDRDDVAIRSGHHCAMPLMTRLGVSATSRASFYVYNGKEDIDRFFAAINDVKVAFAK